MSDLIWLSRAQMRRIEPYFPLSHGVARVDIHPQHTADTHAEIANRGSPLEAAHAAIEVYLVALVDPVLATVRIPIDEQRANERDYENEGADRSVVCVTFHAVLDVPSPADRRAHV